MWKGSVCPGRRWKRYVSWVLKISQHQVPSLRVLTALYSPGSARRGIIPLRRQELNAKMLTAGIPRQGNARILMPCIEANPWCMHAAVVQMDFAVVKCVPGIIQVKKTNKVTDSTLYHSGLLRSYVSKENLSSPCISLCWVSLDVA